MKRSIVPISIAALTRVAWINVVIFVLSVLAEFSKGSIPLLDAYGYKSGVSQAMQVGLFGLSLLIAILLTDNAENRETLAQHVSEELANTRTALLDEFRSAEERNAIFRKELAEGIVEHEGQSYRSLRYAPEDGAIYYGSVHPSNRNILFNNETLKRILQTAQHAHCGNKPVTVEVEEQQKPLLYGLGYHASKRFAQHFQEQVQFEFDLAIWLKEWTKYDSNAGFGRMEVKEIAEDRHEALVVITNSFLTHGGDRGGPESLCDFMIGYIEGLLKNFADGLYEQLHLDRKHIRVVHDKERQCFHGHGNPNRGCEFLVQVPRLPITSQPEPESNNA